MKKLKLNFGQVDEILTRKQLKQVIGGNGSGGTGSGKPCDGKKEGDSCPHPSGGNGRCEYWPFAPGTLVCNKRTW